MRGSRVGFWSSVSVPPIIGFEEMKTMVSAALSLVVCLSSSSFFFSFSCGSSVNDAFSWTLQRALRNFNAGLEAVGEDTEELLHLSRPYVPIGSWRDCGRGKTVVSIKGFQMNGTCLKTPGRVLIAFNVSANSDVIAPISADLKVQMRAGRMWKDVCDQLAGGCRRDDVCPKSDWLSSAEETEADDGQQPPLSASSAGVCIAKGFTIRTSVLYDVPKASAGTYRAVVRLKKGSDVEVACLNLLFKVCA